MAATTNNFGDFTGASDQDINDLISGLSQGPGQDELSAAGLSQSGRPGDPTNIHPWGSNATVQEFARNDFGKKKSTDESGKDLFYDRVALASPSAAIYHGMRRSATKKAQEGRQKAYDQAYQAAFSNYMKDREQRVAAAKSELQRRQHVSQINSFFGSDGMKGLYDSLRSNVLQNSLAQIVQQYHGQMQQQAFQTAGQGLTGSAVDAQRRGDTAQQQDAAGVQAAGQADQYVQGVQNQNEARRQNLVSTLSQDNPGDSAQLSASEKQIQDQTQQTAAGFANQAANNQINQGYLNNQSQALGNLMSTFGSLYRSGQTAQAYGGGSAF